MEYIAHRVNKVDELMNLPSEYGVELDLRDDLEGNIYIQHNPFENGESFEEYLKNYCHGTMICNIKSERIEHKCLKLLEKYDIQKFFFLDSSFPMIWLLSSMNEMRMAVRLSEYEGIDTVRNMAGKVEWVWIDCFNKIPIGVQQAHELKLLGYKLCFVSPELQGRPNDIEKYAKIIGEMQFDAICTKSYNIGKWKQLLE